MRRKWLRWMLLLLVLLLAGSFGLSLALRGGWASRALLARLSAGFGRPVEVGRFGFSLLKGPRLEAQSVTVYDDPRFGQEYFLRAEQLTAGVRWSALIRGRFEFDTVSLTRPSLNLVRLADGQWNIERWLPPLPTADSAARTAARAGGGPPLTGESGGVIARLSRIEVQDGRINFKRDSRKLPLALVAVEGRFDHTAAGYWDIDVQANPMRAPASLQEVGTLRVRGVVGGTSTRLRPASLSLRWEQASLADLSRLARGQDYGIHGTLDAELTARIDDSPSPASSWGEWSLEGKVRLQNVHGWALAAHPGDPSADVSFQAQWMPAEYRLLVTRCVVESPQSRLSATIDLDWSRGFRPVAQVTSARIGFADLLAWRRAFRSGDADDLDVDGSVEMQAALSGWPLRVDELAVAADGATVRSAGLPGSIRIGPIVTEWRGGTLRLRQTPVFLPVAAATPPTARGATTLGPTASSSTLLVEASLGPLPALDAFADARYRLAVSGSARRAQDILAVARAWRGSTEASWAAEGPISLQLAWAGSLRSESAAATGTIQARGVQLTTALMNRPVLVDEATIELRGTQRRIDLKSLEALGAHWRGSLRAPANDDSWEFDLSADHLDASEFYSWLGEPARPNLLRRLLPFGDSSASSAASVRVDALERLQARGRLRVAQLSFSPLLVERIDAQAVVAGPSIVLRQGRADLYDGRITGNFEARLAAEPQYTFDGRFDRVDLDAVGATASLPLRLSGLAAGDLKLSAHGSDRAALAASLQGQGVLRARDAALDPLEPALAPAAASVDADPGLDRRPFALTSRFQIESGRIRLDQLLLARPAEQTEVTGTVDFTRRLDLRVRFLPHPAAPSAAAAVAVAPGSWTISGTLDVPLIVSVPVPAPAPATNTRSGNGVPSASR